MPSLITYTVLPVYNEIMQLPVARCSVGRSLTRWSARVLAASFLLAGLTPVVVAQGNLFDSLASQLRDAAICITRVPQWAAALLLLVGYGAIAGALWSAMYPQLTPYPGGENAVGLYRGMRANRWLIYQAQIGPLASSGPLRRKLIWGAFTWALLSGVASTAIAALFLVWLKLSSLLSWLLIVVVTLAIDKVEWALTDRLYARYEPRREAPDPVEIALRSKEYEYTYPESAHTPKP